MPERRPDHLEPGASHAGGDGVNWSEELEEFHQETSRDHPIEVLTRRTMLGRLGPVPAGGTVIDVGCSTGYLLGDLRNQHRGARVMGFDMVRSGLRHAARAAPGALPVLADARRLPLEDRSVDALVSANLLEHIADDGAALGEMFRVLRPGSRAVLVVPTGPGVYDYYDRYLHHERRYARGELAAKGESVGFELVGDTHLGCLLFPAFWAVKKRNRLRYDGLHGRELEDRVRRDYEGTGSSRGFVVACRLEQVALDRHIPFPFGIRGLTVFRRPG